MWPRKRIEDFEVRNKFYTNIMNRYRWSDLELPILNSLIRTIMRAKFLADRIVVSVSCRGKEEEIDHWFEQRNVFFGFANGRSGTTFLARFLNREVKDGIIEHEPNIDDYLAYPEALQSHSKAVEYVKGFRKREIFSRLRGIDVKCYGEINPYLGMHARAFREQIPSARFFHLVRDGRDVIRSYMSREMLTEKDPMNRLVAPPPHDPYADKWETMDQFERLCWLWRIYNTYLGEEIGHTVRFEDILSSYDYFKERLLDHLGLFISKDVWDKYAKEIHNSTPRYKFPHWQQWTEKQRQTFKGICGDQMRRHGYEL